MPKARQRYLLGKLTSMKRLKVFLDVAESARINLKPIQAELFSYMLERVVIRPSKISEKHDASGNDWQLTISPEILPFLIQRLEGSRNNLIRNEKLDIQQCSQLEVDEYLKYVFTSKPNSKKSYDSVIRNNSDLTVANSLKIDLKIMFESHRNYDTIIIPSNCTNEMVIPLSINKNEINTLHKISSCHKVHKVILWNGFKNVVLTIIAIYFINTLS
jgi:hypothetical protein